MEETGEEEDDERLSVRRRQQVTAAAAEAGRDNGGRAIFERTHAREDRVSLVVVVVSRKRGGEGRRVAAHKHKQSP